MPGNRPSGAEAGAGRQRIDKWLWFARIVKTRESAAALVSAGHVRLNRARLAKPSHDVRPGDVLTIVLNARVRVLRVLALAERRGAATAARSLYSEPGAPAADAPAMSETGGGAPQKEDASEDGNC